METGGKETTGDLGVDGLIMLLWICWKRVVYRVLVVQPEGKRNLVRTRGRCVDNIRMDLWGQRSV